MSYNGDRLIILPALTLDEIHRIYENTYSAPSRCDLTVRQKLQWIRDEFPPPSKPERTY